MYAKTVHTQQKKKYMRNKQNKLDYIQQNKLDFVWRSEQLHKLLQYLSDEDELVGNRTHQEIIDGFNQLV